MRISDWSSDVCSSDLANGLVGTISGGHPLSAGAGGLGEELRRADPGYAPDPRLEPLIPHPEYPMASPSDSVPYGRRQRSEERRVGKEWVSTCRSRCEPSH